MHGNIQNIQTIFRPYQMLIKMVVMFSLLINAVILLLYCLVLILHPYIHYLSLRPYFLFKHCSDLYVTDSALKYPELCTNAVRTSISDGVKIFS